MGVMIVVIVSIVMISFVAFAIIKIKKQLEVQINKDVDRLSTYYDNILDEKMMLLSEVEEKIKKMQEIDCSEPENKEKIQGESHVIMNDNKYIHSSFFKDYNKIKNQFSNVATTYAINKVIELLEERKNNKVQEYKLLNEKLNFNVLYNLESLGIEDQLEVLQTVLGQSVEQNSILEEYMNAKQNFKLNDFVSYLNDYIFANDTEIIIASNQGFRLIEEDTKGITYVKDTTIGEGYKIRYKDRMYDYSISLGGSNE